MRMTVFTMIVMTSVMVSHISVTRRLRSMGSSVRAAPTAMASATTWIISAVASAAKGLIGTMCRIWSHAEMAFARVSPAAALWAACSANCAMSSSREASET